MKNLHVANFFKGAKTFVSKHSPEILTGLGIAGMITSTILAIQATPKALQLIEEKKHEEGTDELTPVEVVKATWKCYIPTAVTAVTSVGCLICASSVNLRRNAALATAYKLSETALVEYKEQVLDTLGEKKEKQIREKVDKKRLDNHPVTNSEVIITKTGTTMCFDPLSGRHFQSSIEQLKRAENNLNKRLLHDITGYVSLNEFYDELDLPHTSVGDDLGWNTDELLDIDFSSQINDKGEPEIVIDYLSAPKYNFYYIHS